MWSLISTPLRPAGSCTAPSGDGRLTASAGAEPAKPRATPGSCRDLVVGRRGRRRATSPGRCSFITPHRVYRDVHAERAMSRRSSASTWPRGSAFRRPPTTRFHPPGVRLALERVPVRHFLARQTWESDGLHVDAAHWGGLLSLAEFRPVVHFRKPAGALRQDSDKSAGSRSESRAMHVRSLAQGGMWWTSAGLDGVHDIAVEAGRSRASRRHPVDGGGRTIAVIGKVVTPGLSPHAHFRGRQSHGVIRSLRRVPVHTIATRGSRSRDLRAFPRPSA